MSGLRFTNGSLTVVINDPSTSILRQVLYVPHSPEIEKVEYTDAMGDGGEQPVTVYRNVTEPIDVYFDGGVSTLVTAVRNLEILFEQARQYQRKKQGPQVWFEFRLQDTDAWLRSEVLAGRLEHTESLLSWGVDIGAAFFTIIITRRFYFEGAEVLATITNGNGTGSALGIWNQDTATAGRDNWVQVSSPDGDLPTPAKITITNTYSNSAARMSHVHIGQSAIVLPATSYLSLQAEAMTGVTFYDQIISNANYAGGQGRRWTFSSQFNTKMGWWTLSSAQLAALAGGYYKLLYHGDIGGNISLRVKILLEQLTVLWEGSWTRLNGLNSPLELDVAQLPPYMLSDMSSLYPLDITLYGRSDSPGSNSVDVDYLQLLPVESWSVLNPRGYDTGLGVTLTDDEARDVAYTEGWATAGKVGNYVRQGTGVLLKPGMTNRLHFAMGGSGGASRTATVTVSYRPRRLTF